MKKSFFLIGIIALFLLHSLAGCDETRTRTIKASGSYVTKEVKNLAPFTGIRLYGKPDVEFRQSKNEKTTVYVYAPANLVDLIETTTQDQVLHIKIEDRIKIMGKAKIKVIVSAPYLSNADIIGSGNIVLMGSFKSKKLQISIQGSGDFSGENIHCAEVNLNITGSGDVKFKQLTCNTVSVNVMGSGDVSLLGSAQEARFSVKGSGEIGAKKFVVNELNAAVFGSGDISCYPVQRLDAQVFGSGEITYVGNPRHFATVGNRNRIRRVK